MTSEIITKLENAFSYDMSHEEACLQAGIARATLSNYLSKNPKFRERIELLRNQPFVYARKAWIDSFKDEKKPDVEAAIKYMERKKKDEFSLRQEVDQTTTLKIKTEQEEKIEKMLEENPEIRAKIDACIYGRTDKG